MPADPNGPLRNRVTADLEFVRQQLYALLVQDDLYWRMHAVIQSNSERIHAEGAMVTNWMHDGYVFQMLIGLRALGDRNRKSRSLYTVLDRLVRHAPALLSRHHYCSCYRSGQLEQDYANTSFDALAGKGHTHYPARYVFLDRESLVEMLRPINLYTNKFVAHWGRAEPDAPTYRMIRRALYLTLFLVNRYLHLLQAVSISLQPPAIGPRWWATFWEPWLPDRAPPPRTWTLDEAVAGLPPPWSPEASG